MKNLIYSIFIVGFMLTSCKAQMNEDTIETWWINSSKADCVGVGPMSCLQVQANENLDPDMWTFFYDQIKGFDYEPGNIYQVKVKITEREEPVPADASSKIYELIEVISKEADPRLRLTNIWKVLSVGEIENPTKFRSEEALTFEFDASKSTYVGHMGCNSVRGEIKKNDGSNLELGPGASTMMACPDMSAENQISKALIEVSTYKIEGNQLHFYDASGDKLMSFQAVD
ncbi:DUF4377 domain-containing protein [Algoriphagus namhaensis]